MNSFKCLSWTFRLIAISVITLMGAGFSKASAAQETGVKKDTLESLMGDYKQQGNQVKAIETAQKILQADPCNLRALSLLASTKRAIAETGESAQQNIKEAGQYGEKGLQCLQSAHRPEDMSDADFLKFKAQIAVIFNGSAGISVLQDKTTPKLSSICELRSNPIRTMCAMSIRWRSPILCQDRPNKSGMASSLLLEPQILCRRGQARTRSNDMAGANISSIVAQIRAGRISYRQPE